MPTFMAKNPKSCGKGAIDYGINDPKGKTVDRERENRMGHIGGKEGQGERITDTYEES